jgi:iron complex outermembrane receptor protein
MRWLRNRAKFSGNSFCPKFHTASVVVVLTCTAHDAHAQTSDSNESTTENSAVSALDSNRIFELGELVMTADAEEATGSEVTADTLQDLELDNVARALRSLPGVSLTRFGGRNEEAVYVRGFDRRQVPIYVDGVPVSVPYDGFADLARFTTMDVASIELEKGYSSVLSGVNAMGGVVNIISKRPQEALEGDAEFGISSGGGVHSNLNIGTAQDKWYAQFGVGYSESDYRLLSDGEKSDNSYEQDQKISGKIAYTPNDTDEYVIGFVHQEGEKGTPPYAGTDPTANVRYWQWPEWDKDTVYFTSMTELDDFYIRPRFYYDQYENTLMSYDDDTYSTQTKGSSFTSIYDDYTYGGSVEVGTYAFDEWTIKAALHYKLDHHDEHDEGEEHSIFEDESWSSGIEATREFGERWLLSFGLNYDWMQSKKAIDTNTTDPIESTDFDSLNPALRLTYDLDKYGKLRASIARKSRFPTLKDRYSYKMGTAIPAPDLEAESVMHYEFGYTVSLLPDLMADFTVFYSQIEDSIESVDNVTYDADEDAWLSQNQNVGEAIHQGFEMVLTYTPTPKLTVGLNYSYLDRDNVSHPDILPTNTPKHSGSVQASYQALEWLTLLGYLEWSDKRYSTSTGTQVDGFVVGNLKATFELPNDFFVDLGVKNVADVSYGYSDGYPEAGRNYFANIRYEF